ncbi:MAG: SDR family oxidoreductase [Magnetococcales bacterium]|nr:SDR family oxidoreductase [Magnetococcales bacterium]
MSGRPGTVGRFLKGFKGGLALCMALPFIILLLPMWYIYRWDKKRSGEEVPEAPWALLFNGGRSRKQSQGSRRARRSYRYDDDLSEEGQDYGPSRGEDAGLESLVSKPERGRVALVTGGGQRIGAAISRDLAELGYVVAVVYHKSAKEAGRVVESIIESGGKAESFALDLRNPAKISAMLNEVSRKLGPVDLLINNASLFLPTPIEEKDGQWEIMESLFQVNLQGPMMLAMLAIRSMEERGGVVINMCDIWAEKPLQGHAAYSAAKAGLISATQVLAREAAPEVRVNAIAPGAILAPESRAGKGAFEKSLGRTPLARAASPDAILQAIRYLLTADYVTGEVLHVDGGRRLV